MNIVYGKDKLKFNPNVTPKEMFTMGVFGGTYWRPIYSSITGKSYKNKFKKYSFFKQIPNYKLCSGEYDKSLNYFGVKCGSSLEDWEDAGWITKYDPYGWV